MLYLAYGSNLNIDQMRWRCPDAVPVGKGVLKGWRLEFRLHATIEPCEGDGVPFVLWDISKDDEIALDKYEGFPTYYYKRFVDVEYETFDGDPLSGLAMVYIMTKRVRRQVQEPTEGYLLTITDGYETFGLDYDPLRRAVYSAILPRNKQGGIRYL